MVQTLLETLQADERFAVQHVNLNLSSDAGDVGRWRIGKMVTTWRAARAARRVLGAGKDTWLYYVPAPAKRGALFRDWLVMAMCRRRARGLILHWHAVGLGEWLQARGLLSSVTAWLLRRPELSVVLARELGADVAFSESKEVAIVANGLDVRAELGQDGAVPKLSAESNRLDQGRALRETGEPEGGVIEVLFLGLCSRTKGLFRALDAVMAANERGGVFGKKYRLTVAGGFADAGEEKEFHARAAEMGEAVRWVGFADEERKSALWAEADVFIFPTQYAHEAMPLVLIEAMAHGVPIVTTRWRAIPGMLPERGAVCVEPGQLMALASALGAVERGPEARAALRVHYERHFTRAEFGRAMVEVLLRAEKERGA